MGPMTPEAITAARQAAYEDAQHEYSAAQAREAIEERHEAHGGWESPDTDACVMCRDELEQFMLWGGVGGVRL